MNNITRFRVKISTNLYSNWNYMAENNIKSGCGGARPGTGRPRKQEGSNHILADDLAIMLTFGLLLSRLGIVGTSSTLPSLLHQFNYHSSTTSSLLMTIVTGSELARLSTYDNKQ